MDMDWDCTSQIDIFVTCFTWLRNNTTAGVTRIGCIDETFVEQVNSNQVVPTLLKHLEQCPPFRGTGISEIY